MHRRRGVVRCGVSALAFAISMRQARTREVGHAEERVFRGVNDAPGELYGPTWLVMQSGSLAAVFVVAAGLFQRGNPAAVRALVAGTAVWGGVKVVKPLVGRGRPAHHLDDVVVRGAPQTGLGFPSGHAAVATVLALTSTSPATPARWVAGTIALTTGLARMYVGAHLPADVLGGLAIGVLVGTAVEQL